MKLPSSNRPIANSGTPKYGSQDVPRAIARRGSAVTIVEGGDPGKSDGYVEALDRALRLR